MNLAQSKPVSAKPVPKLPVPNFDLRPRKVKRVKRYIRYKRDETRARSPDVFSELRRAQLITGNDNEYPVFVDYQNSRRHKTVKPQKQSTPQRSKSLSGDEMFSTLNNLFSTH